MLVRAPLTMSAERRYIFDVVLSEWLGLDYQLTQEVRHDVAIYLEGDPGDRVLRVADVLLGSAPEDWLSTRSLATSPLARLTLGPGSELDLSGPDVPQAFLDLPVLFGGPTEDGGYWKLSPDAVELTIDLFGSVFYLITRYEEVVLEERDDFGRFPARASLAYKEEFLDRPIVDEYVDLLWSAVHLLWPALTRRTAEFELCLTHDVDRPWAARGHNLVSVGRALGADVVRRRDPGLAARRLRAVVDARSGRVDRDPFNTFELLMNTSENYGLRSVFYFMSGVTDARFDGSYDIEDPAIISLLGEVHRRGHLVGLHASYDTFRSADRLRSEFDRLRSACALAGFTQDVWGVRQHYLRFDAAVTWRNQAAAGLDYDSTLGFAEANGFRAGTTREFPVFDLRGHKPLKLRERGR